jgi:MoaA/NifB/PqqE/SkfB family radical SAM enzyme
VIYSASSIKSVHVEMTSRCNAACPMCARNVLGGQDNPNLPLTELSLDQFKKALPPSFVAHLNKIFLCGNYGDPIAAKDTLAALQYIRAVNPTTRLGINTNASAKDVEWWSELGALLSQDGDYCKFSLDGLEDTNHLYRRGTQWDRIMRNVRAFIAAGGKAHWDFIVFRHNEHQIEEARQMSRDMGFELFQVKKTGRFYSNTKSQGKDEQEVKNRKGEIEYVLEKPLDPQWQNQALQKENDLVNRYGSMDSYLDSTPIVCKTGAEKSIYLSAEGLVFPCCWTGNQMYLWYHQPESTPIWDLIRNVGGKDAISALNHSIDDIIEGPFFQSIEDTWSKPSCAAGKLKVCAKTCGTEFDQFKMQFQG